MIPQNIRRALSLGIPALDAASFFGITESIFGLALNTNIASTGITWGMTLGAANLFLLYLIWARQVP